MAQPMSAVSIIPQYDHMHSKIQDHEIGILHLDGAHSNELSLVRVIISQSVQERYQMEALRVIIQ